MIISEYLRETGIVAHLKKNPVCYFINGSGKKFLSGIINKVLYLTAKSIILYPYINILFGDLLKIIVLSLCSLMKRHRIRVSKTAYHFVNINKYRKPKVFMYKNKVR